LCRIGATDYDESIRSLLYPGNQLSQYVLREAVYALEDVLNLSALRRKDICLRLDAGFGTDDNLNWALGLGYQLCAKNNSGRRAGSWGQQVQDWQEVEAGHRWVAIPKQQLVFCVPTRTLAVRWLDHRKSTFKHALYVVTDLQSPPTDICHLYDLRGGAEVDIRDDKQGLLLAHRRKRRWHAQEMLILLNDLAHNFLSMFRYLVLAQTPLANFGPYRIIQDVLSIPGEVFFEGDTLIEVRLSQDHPYSEILSQALPRLWF
jgi:hypothetical protein